MKITVACVGKIKEKYLRDGIQEYAKRLSRYCRLEWYEVADERTPEGASAAQEEKIQETEGLRLLRGIPDSSYVIALAIQEICWTLRSWPERSQTLAAGESAISYSSSAAPWAFPREF